MTRQYQCPWARQFDASHPVCKSCGIDCALKLASKPLNLTAETSLPHKKGKQPNKTEQSYMNALAFEMPGADIRYEAITLVLKNGLRYTPDILVTMINNVIMLVEVKNANYKHASYGRSRMAYEQAKLDFPHFCWRWVEKNGSDWQIKDFR